MGKFLKKISRYLWVKTSPRILREHNRYLGSLLLTTLLKLDVRPQSASSTLRRKTTLHWSWNGSGTPSVNMCTWVCHVAPPAVPEKFLSKGGSPKPFRSPEYPDGLPSLSPRDKERVRKANLVYSAACRLILACHASGTAWALENPTNSLSQVALKTTKVPQHEA